MNWSVRKFKNNCIIDIPANIFNDEVTDSLKNLITELSENDHKNFFLDLSQISKVNSKGLASIINIYQMAYLFDIEVKLFNIQPYVLQLIYQTRLNQLFDICDPEQDRLLKQSLNSYKTIRSA